VSRVRYPERVARLRQTTGVEIAMDLYALGEQLLRQRLRREHPDRSPAAIKAEVNR